jgi:hypothetical protein
LAWRNAATAAKRAQRPAAIKTVKSAMLTPLLIWSLPTDR